MRTSLGSLAVVLALTPLGCDSSKNSTNGPAEPSSAPSEKPAPSSAAAPTQSSLRAPIPIPSGPAYPIAPGVGVGPIRFGATQKTIERLMEAPCDTASADVCRYVARAIEFRMKDGVVHAMAVQRRGRQAGKDAQGHPLSFGVFNGMIPPDLEVGMIPSAIQEYLGAPDRIEALKNPGPDGNAERHYYAGLTLTYDRLENGNLALGEALIEHSDHPVAAKGSKRRREIIH
jgi:hypothetical protein